VEDGAYLKAVIELERDSDKKDMPLPSAKPFSPAAPAADKPPTSTSPDMTKGK
jgi:hypothetical protein